MIEDRFLLGESDSIGDHEGCREGFGYHGRRWVSRGHLGIFRRWIPFLEILFRQNFGEIPKTLGGVLERKALGHLLGKGDG